MRKSFESYTCNLNSYFLSLEFSAFTFQLNALILERKNSECPHLSKFRKVNFCKNCGEFSGEVLYDLQILAVNLFSPHSIGSGEFFKNRYQSNAVKKNSPLKIANRKKNHH